MYYIVIREQKDTDTPAVSETLRNAYVSNVSNTFFNALVNEATFQIIVIVSALLFIFFQIRLLYCLMTVPVILLLMYVVIYGAWTMKSAQIMYEKRPLCAWVAEAYEPYFTDKSPVSCSFKIVTERDFKEDDIRFEGRRKIIGTVAVMKHFHDAERAWLYRLAVDARYRRKGVALRLVQTVRNWCKTNRFNNIELAMSECQEGARELFAAAGFETKQLYHKKLLTSFYMIQMFHLVCEVRPTFS
ncbi:uncharacterized protein LOC132697742 [Cylas formicarius]|uniref:uncharacterized protein LOC132697742 n=1 Tax=Cylas formicarius TaxID=197179 RepID=UPI002958D053|nr:uncharacterized protein LOC132697742 [Cylas formicarius]